MRLNQRSIGGAGVFVNVYQVCEKERGGGKENI